MHLPIQKASSGPASLTTGQRKSPHEAGLSALRGPRDRRPCYLRGAHRPPDRTSDRADITCLVALRAGGAFERDTLVLGQALEAFRLDVLEVREQIVTARIGSDEAEAFGVIEPFHDAGLSSH